MIKPQYPVFYHAHHTLNSEDLPFYLELASQVGGPILELGCGTGRVIEPLAEARYLVLGLDLDFNMLRYLHQRMNTEGKACLPVFQADMSSFCLRRLFPLILLPCNTYSTFPPEIRQKTLNRVVRHLAPGGIFAISLPNPVILADLESEADAELEDEVSLPTGEVVQVSSAWRKFSDRVVIEWQYDLLTLEGRIDRYRMEAVHFLTPVETYLDEFAQTGWNVKSVFGDYDFSPYTPESPYLIFLLHQ